MRILHIMGSADYGGIPSVVYNYMTHIDRDKYHFDFALNTEPGYLGREMMKMGASFYKLPLRSRGLKKHEDALTEILKSQHFDAIHVHSSTTSYVDLRIARKMGIKCRIAHAHTTPICSSAKSKLRKYSGWIFNRVYATTMMACSKQARNAVFGAWDWKTMILPNAIDTERFRFNHETRHSIRKKLGLEDKYVIGMVASFSPLKNHRFALEVFDELRKKDDSFMMVLVGDGPTYMSSIRYCAGHGLEKQVLFLGKRQDPEIFYNAFDVCVFPSFTEGFSIAGLEAITSGLPLMLSEQVPRELDFGEKVSYLPLEKSRWVDALLLKPVNLQRENAYKAVAEEGYDINDTVHLLEEIYKTS